MAACLSAPVEQQGKEGTQLSDTGQYTDLVYCRQAGAVRLPLGAVSFTIEILQLLAGRYAEIDDVLLNTLGTFSGCLIFTAVSNFRKKAVQYLTALCGFLVVCFTAIIDAILSGSLLKYILILRRPAGYPAVRLWQKRRLTRLCLRR